MKFVFVDPPYLKSKYISKLKDIKNISDVEVYDKAPGDDEEVISRAKHAELVSSDIYVQFNKNVLSELKNLKAIFTQSVGYNNIDVDFAKQKGIKVFNCAGFNANGVAEFIFGLIISLFRKIPAANEHVRSSGWNYRLFEGKEIRGLTIGIVGSGNVAKEVAKIARGFSMNVIAFTRAPTYEKALQLGINEFVGLKDLLKQSDIVVLTVPLNSSTKDLLNIKNISLMKKEAIIVNTSRQGVVNEVDLAEALIERKIAGAVLDVVISEPFYVNEQKLIIQEMINLPNVITTPHIAGVTEQSSDNLGRVFVDNVKSYLDGKKINLVNW